MQMRAQLGSPLTSMQCSKVIEMQFLYHSMVAEQSVLLTKMMGLRQNEL